MLPGITPFLFGLPNLVVLSSPSTISNTQSGMVISTATVTTAVTGGSGAYTAAWVKQSGDAITAMSPTALNSAFMAGGMAPGEDRIAEFQCVVTDTPSGVVKIGNPVTVMISRL